MVPSSARAFICEQSHVQDLSASKNREKKKKSENPSATKFISKFKKETEEKENTCNRRRHQNRNREVLRGREGQVQSPRQCDLRPERGKMG